MLFSYRKKRSSLKRKTRLNMESLESRELLTTNNVFLSEIHFGPTLGNPIEDQYLEIRSDAGQTIADNIYVLGVESDGDDPSDQPGKINAIFDLSGATVGSNGFITFLQEGAGFAVDAASTLYQGTTNGFKDMPGGRYQGFTGQFESITGSETFLIVDTSAGSAPVLSSDIDANDDGQIDAGNNWTIIDSVTSLKDGNSSFSGDLAYGEIVFRGENNTSSVPGNKTLVDTDEQGYVARVFQSTGSAATDWVAGATKELGSTGVFALSDGDNGLPTPAYFAGKQLTHLGADNFFDSIRGSAPAGSTILVDQNNNEIIDSYAVRAEPDDLPATSQLINAFPGVTLTGADANQQSTGFSITSYTSGPNNASTGTSTFAYSGIPTFGDIFQMRMDFFQPTDAINLDFRGGSNSGPSIGAIAAYDASGNLLQTVTSAPLSGGQLETVSVFRESPDIAYAFAYADASGVRKQVYLDNLRFNQSEVSVVANESGEYVAGPIWSGDPLLVTNLSTGNKEAVRQDDLPATGVDFDGVATAQQDIFGRVATNGNLQIARHDGTDFDFLTWGNFSPNVAWNNINVGDVTGDGLDDIVARTGGGEWWVARSTGDGFVNEYWGKWSIAVVWQDLQLADVTGDGKQDIIGRANGNWWVGESTGSAFATKYWGRWSNSVQWDDVLIADFDDDGKEDIAGRTSGQWWVSLSQGTFFLTQYWGKWSNSVVWEDVSTGDFNGDGVADIAGRANGRWWISQSTGSFFATSYWGIWSTAVSWDDVLVADVNGDNKSDILGRVNGTWWVSRSADTFFRTEQWANWSDTVTWEEVLIADINGDRMDDIVGRTGSTWWTSKSVGDRFNVNYGGNKPDSVNWQGVQAGAFGDSASSSAVLGQVEDDQDEEADAASLSKIRAAARLLS